MAVHKWLSLLPCPAVKNLGLLRLSFRAICYDFIGSLHGTFIVSNERFCTGHAKTEPRR